MHHIQSICVSMHQLGFIRECMKTTMLVGSLSRRECLNQSTQKAISKLNRSSNQIQFQGFDFNQNNQGHNSISISKNQGFDQNKQYNSNFNSFNQSISIMNLAILAYGFLCQESSNTIQAIKQSINFNLEHISYDQGF